MAAAYLFCICLVLVVASIIIALFLSSSVALLISPSLLSRIFGQQKIEWSSVEELTFWFQYGIADDSVPKLMERVVPYQKEMRVGRFEQIKRMSLELSSGQYFLLASSGSHLLCRFPEWTLMFLIPFLSRRASVLFISITYTPGQVHLVGCSAIGNIDV